MFSQVLLVSFAAVLALPILAVATPVNGARWATATTACCTSTETTDSTDGAALLASLGISAQSVVGLIGLGCSPITVIGVGTGSCDTNTVSCTNVVNGGIGIGCLPVSA